jgi:hypothetical protein
MAGSYRSPAAAPLGNARSICARSLSVNCTSRAQTFSSSRATLLVPGMGITYGVRSNQARANCQAYNFLARKQPHGISDCQILRKVLSLKTGITAAPVVGCQVVQSPDASCQKATAQGAVRDDRYAQIAQHRKQCILRLPRPQRELSLYRSDRMYRTSTPDRLRRDF